MSPFHSHDLKLKILPQKNSPYNLFSFLICRVNNAVATENTTSTTKQTPTTPHPRPASTATLLKYKIRRVCPSAYVRCAHYITHNGPGLCDEEEFSESSVKRQQHSDTGGILAQAVFHRHEELPQRSQQSQLAGSGVQTRRHLDKQTHTYRQNRLTKSHIP